MKQSPAPEHHSPAALQWLPRLIQESCARVSQPTHAVSTIAATKIRIGDEGRSQVWLRWPRIAGAVPHPCRDRSTPRGGPSAASDEVSCSSMNKARNITHCDVEQGTYYNYSR